MSKLDKLINDFVETGILDYYEPYLHSPMNVIASLMNLNDYMQALGAELVTAFTDKKIIEEFYLDYLPKEFIAFPDEVLAIHELLIDWYHYLYKKNHISKQKYMEMADFLQELKPTYLDRMCDDRYWSKEKTRSFDEFDIISPEEIMAQEPMFDNPMFQGLKKELQKISDALNPKQKSTEKIIPFPNMKKLEVKTDALQLRVDLKGFKPPIWRRVLIPDNLTFAQLHLVIQSLFEWENYHLYSFDVDGIVIEPEEQNDEMSDFYFEEILNAETTYVKDFLQEGSAVDYTYDFGDDWEHKIKLEKTIAASELPEACKGLTMEQLPYCVKGKGDAPEEDSRAEERYAHFDIEDINKRFTSMRDK